MKTIRITLEKDGVAASVIHRYRYTDWPAETKWTGNRDAFSANGRHLNFIHGIDNLERTLAHQAALCGATYKIEDLGGDAKIWIDRVDG